MKPRSCGRDLMRVSADSFPRAPQTFGRFPCDLGPNYFITTSRLSSRSKPTMLDQSLTVDCHLGKKKEGFGPARWVKSCFVGRGQLPGRASAPRALELLPGRLTRAGRCVGAFGPVLAQRALLRAAKRFSLAFLARSPFGGTGQWAPLRLPLQSGVGSIFLVASSRLSAISVAHTRSSARFGPTGTGPNQSVIRV